MPGIKAIDSKNLTVKNCKFSGFNIDIELKNALDSCFYLN